MSGSPFIENLRAALAPHGLSLRGILHPADPPPLADGRPAATVMLVGHVGSAFWPAFSAWHAQHPDRADPLDNWSKAVVGPLADRLGATVWYPSDPPYEPFQRWAQQAEGLKASPLGILVHPEYGLWHGYRAALGFAEAVTDPHPVPPRPHPCDSCAPRPCLASCPAGAVTAAGFDVAACRGHLATAGPGGTCLSQGCLARAACPVGAAHRYRPEHLRFHMAALKL